MLLSHFNPFWTENFQTKKTLNEHNDFLLNFREACNVGHCLQKNISSSVLIFVSNILVTQILLGHKKGLK
jgi:hypothetical protein